MEESAFDFFSLEERFDVDAAALNARYREAMRRSHPDRFVNASALEKKAALITASRANDAYAILKDPVKRARHICERHGVSPDKANPPASFLMDMMELGEAASNADTAAKTGLLGELAAMRDRVLNDIGLALSESRYQDAAAALAKLNFIDKHVSFLS